MRLPRIRLTMRALMVLVAISSLAVWFVIDQTKRFNPLVEFTYVRIVENEPLLNPTKLVAIEGKSLILEDGRMFKLVCNSNFDMMQMAGVDPELASGSILDIGPETDGLVTIHRLGPTFYCGNGWRPPLLRIPIIRRDIYQNTRKAIATGQVVGTVPKGESYESALARLARLPTATGKIGGRTDAAGQP